MKKLLSIITCLCFLLVGCSSTSENNNKQSNGDDFKYTTYLNSIDKKNIQEIEVSASFAFDISNITQLRDYSNMVVIATIDSVDGVSTIAGSGEFSPMPKSYGKMTVLKVLKGDSNLSMSDYARPGGVISTAEYERYAPVEMVSNDDAHRKEAGVVIDKDNTFFDYQFKNDIEFEAGKTYLLFGTYIEKTGTLFIDGVQYSTREVKQDTTNTTVFRSMPKESDLRVKDNDTGEYIPLETIIDEYFK